MFKSLILLITTKKGYWASEWCRKRFPDALYTRKLFSKLHSTHWANSLLLFLYAFIKIWLSRPKILFVGSAVTVGLWLEECKRRGLLPRDSMLLIHNRHYERIKARAIDAVIHDSTYEVNYFSQHDPETKHYYVPYCMEYKLPQLASEKDVQDGSYQFPKKYFLATGSAGRNYASLTKALEGTDMTCVITAQVRDGVSLPVENSRHIKVYKNLPDDVYWYLFSKSLAVIVCLEKNEWHMGGGSTVLKAIQLGKPVVTEPYHCDYVKDEGDGFLIDTNDHGELAKALLKIWNDDELASSLGGNAIKSGSEFKYDRFDREIKKVISDLL